MYKLLTTWQLPTYRRTKNFVDDFCKLKGDYNSTIEEEIKKANQQSKSFMNQSGKSVMANKGGKRIDKSQISSPSDFRVVQHVGFDDNHDIYELLRTLQQPTVERTKRYIGTNSVTKKEEKKIKMQAPLAPSFKQLASDD